MNYKYSYIQMIAQEQSISRAAMKLYVSQPYLSKILNETESSLGVKLFERKQHLEITPEGIRFLRYIKESSQLEEQMLSDLAELRHAGVKTFGVGISPSRVPYIIPYVIPPFKTRFPNVDVLISENHYSQILDDILNDRIQIGIVSPLMNLNKVAIEPIHEENLLLVLPPEHPLGSEEARGNYSDPPMFDISQFPSLCDSPCITVGEGLGLRVMVNRIFNDYNLKNVNLLETNSVDTIFRLVLKGTGFAFIPSSGARDFPLRDKAFYYLFGQPHLKWKQVFAYRDDMEITPAMRYFMKLVKAAYLENAP